MATEIIMPKAGMAMETGTIIRWLKSLGDRVEVGEPILEIETDKVAMEVEAETAGYLLSIVHDSGDEVPVTETIGYIGAQGEVAPQERTVETAAGDRRSGGEQADTAAGRIAATPAARRFAQERGINLRTATPTGPAGEVRLRDVVAEENRSGGTSIEEVPAPQPAFAIGHGAHGATISPLARRIAERNGVPVDGISGTGPGGRVVRRDVETRIGAERKTPQRRRFSGMRKTIAARMATSHAAVPPVTLFRKVGVDELLALRSQVNRDLAVPVSVTALFARASARALADAPYMRTRIDGDELVTSDDIAIGLAVAREDGLLVPVIHDAGTLPLRVLAERCETLVRSARDRTIRAEEMRGAVFTITNLGMYGIHAFTPIVNTPETAILGIAAFEDELFLDGATVRSRRVVMLSLTVDHRVVDGAQGAIFLQSLVDYIENPARLLL